MEEPELYHTQERDTIAILNILWSKVKKHQLHGLHLNTAQILMRDSP